MFAFSWFCRMTTLLGLVPHHHLQNQQGWVESFLHHIPSGLPPSQLRKYDYFGSTQIIQDTLLIEGFLVKTYIHLSSISCSLIFTNVGVQEVDIFGRPLFCLPHYVTGFWPKTRQWKSVRWNFWKFYFLI